MKIALNNYNIKVINTNILFKKYNFVKNRCYLFLINNNIYRIFLLKSSHHFCVKYTNKLNFNMFFCNENNNSYNTPYLIQFNSLKKEIPKFNLLNDLKKFTINFYLSSIFKLEISGYSRRATYAKDTRLLYLRLGQSLVNIRKISNLMNMKLIKTRILFFYSIDSDYLHNFIANLIKLQPTSSYKSSGLLYFNSFIKFKKKRLKSF